MNYTFWNNFNETLSNFMIFACHIITNLFCLNLEKANLYLLNDLTSNFMLPLTIDLYFVFYLFNIFIFILLYLLQLFLNILKQKIFILRILGKVSKQWIRNSLKIFFKLIKELPNPQILVFDWYSFSYFKRAWPGLW